ncbi:hypothetical protein [Pseudoalteromonas luteoviolacea]|uniref:hypothetical protein n=1 Tax=Pseudoalteromonas luteoviolacea TaxID=43657 RepID=UPI001B383C81|nr:hypothetical protein [Pseudoalteromonas luteoviolacea]MBQ4840038.1 hypothetical protein [Pseudoalteromonas luteoviolacea]
MSIKIIQDELQKLSKQGENYVSIESLQDYLENLNQNEDKRNDLVLADFNAKCQSAVEQYKEDCAEWRELFKSVISNGQATIRMLATINGGAALALLAFIGKVWSPDFPNTFTGYNITLSLLFLCIGLGISALTQGLAYLGQHCFTYKRDNVGFIIQKIAVVSGATSLVLFFVGIICACKGFGLVT